MNDDLDYVRKDFNDVNYFIIFIEIYIWAG